MLVARTASALTMRSIRACLIGLILAVSALAGCVSPQIQPGTETISRIEDLYLVPMETPPLQIDARFTATGQASIVHFLPRYTVGMARGVGVLSGIVLLLDLSAASHREVDYPPLRQPTETWMPSVEFAHEAARLLAATGKTARISVGVQPVPGVQERGRTLLMENWLAPIRSWYNDDRPSMRYTGLAAGQVDTVAEIGVSNYEIHGGRLLLQVHVKLIDAASGRLLGRARASSNTVLPPMDEAFAADAQRFKGTVSRAGGALVLTCLQELGVAPAK